MLPGPVRLRRPYGTEAFNPERQKEKPVSAVSSRLPVFPWDKLEPYKATAAAHPDGIVDLSVGTPVDPVPYLIQKALVAAADSPGYPTVWGTVELRNALTGWVERRLGAVDVAHTNVLPVVGSKELVAWLPTQLGLGPGDRIAHPGSRIRRTRSARGWPARRPSSTTTRPSSTRPDSSCSGSTRPPTRPAACWPRTS